MNTRDKLVRAAEELMLRNGYSATRVDEVIRKAGVTKGSFYHFFDSKEALGLAALERYYADRVERLASGSFAAESEPSRRAHGFVDHAYHVAADLWTTGCLLASFAADAAGSSPAISKVLRKRVDDLRALLMDLLGPFASAEVTAADLAEQFLICVEGSIVLARIYDDPLYLQHGLAQFRRCLEKVEIRRTPA